MLGFGRTKGDVGCDRMVFAMNSNICLTQIDSTFNGWSLQINIRRPNKLGLQTESTPHSIIITNPLDSEGRMGKACPTETMGGWDFRDNQ